MNVVRGCAPSLLAVLLLIAGPDALQAAEPEQLSARSFDVVVGSEGGRPVLEVTFSLALSELSTYPVTITAIGGSVEEVLWEGTLGEGTYRLRAPLAKIAAGPLKVILKTKVTNRSSERAEPVEDGDNVEHRRRRTGESYLIYRKWEGALPR